MGSDHPNNVSWGSDLELESFFTSVLTCDFFFHNNSEEMDFRYIYSHFIGEQLGMQGA